MSSTTAPTPHAPGLAPGLSREIPPDLDRWNWGAFFLNWIWGFGNRTPIALVCLLPFVGLVMMFVLGAKGSAWAWGKGGWTSAEHFRRVQRRWAIWGALSWVVVIGLTGTLIGIAATRDEPFSFQVGTPPSASSSDGFESSVPYKLALQEVQLSPKAIDALGAPITASGVTGSSSAFNGTGSATLAFTAAGPAGRGEAKVKAVLADNAWRIDTLTLKPEGRDGQIAVVSPAQTVGGIRLDDFGLSTKDVNDRRTVFKVGDTAVAVRFAIHGGRVGSTFDIVWFKIGDTTGGPDEEVATNQYVMEDLAGDFPRFTVTQRDGWQKGRYRIDILVDGTLARSVGFLVVEP